MKVLLYRSNFASSGDFLSIILYGLFPAHSPPGRAEFFPNSSMRLIRKIENILEKMETLAVSVLLSLMILIAFSQVILRNLFNEAILWGDIFIRQLVLWVGFLGASLAARESKHISVDFLPHFLPKTWGKLIQFIVNLTAGIISGFLALAAFRFVQFEMDGSAVLFLDIPVWIFQIILPYSFFVISARFLLKTLGALTFKGNS